MVKKLEEEILLLMLTYGGGVDGEAGESGNGAGYGEGVVKGVLTGSGNGYGGCCEGS